MGGGGSLGSEGHLESVRPAIRWDPQKVCPSPGRGTGRQLESRLWDKVSLEVTRWSGAERGDAPLIFRVTHPPAPRGKQPWLRDTGALSQWPSQAAVPPSPRAVPRLRAWRTWPPALTCPVPLPAGPRGHAHTLSLLQARFPGQVPRPGPRPFHSQAPLTFPPIPPGGLELRPGAFACMKVN